MAFISFYLRWRILFNRLYCCLFNFYLFFLFVVSRLLPFSLWAHKNTHNRKSNRRTNSFLPFSTLFFFTSMLLLFKEINGLKTLQIVHAIEMWNQHSKKLDENRYEENERLQGINMFGWRNDLIWSIYRFTLWNLGIICWFPHSQPCWTLHIYAQVRIRLKAVKWNMTLEF